MKQVGAGARGAWSPVVISVGYGALEVEVLDFTPTCTEKWFLEHLHD